MKHVLHNSRRRLSALLTLAVLATSVMVVPARADARAEHCKAPCRHCQTSSVMTCCDNERSEPSTLPLQTSTAPGASQHWVAVPAFASAIAGVAAAITAPAPIVLGPPHGYRSADLPILKSVFLI